MSAEHSDYRQGRSIGGWLIFIAIDIVLAPPGQLFLLVSTYWPLFRNGTWERLTTAGSEFYDSFWAPLIVSDMLIKTGLVIAAAAVAVLFFAKKAVLPKWYAGLAAFTVVYLCFDAYMASVMLRDVGFFEAVSTRDLARPLSSLIIWTPYLFVSQRAKETFVR